MTSEHDKSKNVTRETKSTRLDIDDITIVKPVSLTFTLASRLFAPFLILVI